MVVTSNQLGNLVQISKWETKKMRNTWKQKFPRSQNESKESNEQRETKGEDSDYRDMLSAGVGVLLVSKVEVLADKVELNYWKKKKEKGRLRS